LRGASSEALRETCTFGRTSCNSSRWISRRKRESTDGIFFKANDAAALQAWYKRHLGINVHEWGGTAFAGTAALPCERGQPRNLQRR